jgi:hypothetical protein
MSGDLYEEMLIIESFPRHLRKLAYEHVGKKAELEVPMLKGLEPETIGHIYVLLDQVHLYPLDPQPVLLNPKQLLSLRRRTNRSRIAVAAANQPPLRPRTNRLRIAAN